MTLTAAQAQRRYVLLTALRWLPVGSTVPVTVLLASSRGLSAAEIGLAFSAHGVVIVLLELPTGGLADALGRRPILLVSGACNLGGLLALAAATDPLGFALAYALVGVGRALDSGPLEAWFVDAVHEADARADTTPGLARAGVADGTALAVGASAGGALPVLLGGSLTAPLLVAAGLTGLQLLAVALLVAQVGPPRESHGPLAALRRGTAEVPRVVTEAVRLAGRDRALRLLLVVSFGTGLVLLTIELLAPLRFAELTGSAAEGGQAYGLVVTLGFAAAAAGSALSTPARRLARGSVGRATAALSLLAGAGVLCLGLGGSAVLLAAGAGLFYLFDGAGWPMRKQLLHSRVTARQRASTVSVSSLALQLGGLTSNQVQARLYDAHGPAAAFGVAAGVLVLLALVSLRLPVAPAAAGALTGVRPTGT